LDPAAQYLKSRTASAVRNKQVRRCGPRLKIAGLTGSHAPAQHRDDDLVQGGDLYRLMSERKAAIDRNIRSEPWTSQQSGHHRAVNRQL